MTLETLVERGALLPLDRHFARAMCRLSGDDDPLVELAAALASRAPAHGHICAELGRLAGTPVHDAEGQPIDDLVWPDAAPWLAAVRESALVGERAPLVLADADLYLRRYHTYQQQLIDHLRARAEVADPPADPDRLDTLLDALFDERSAEQRDAAMLALTRRLSVISGGPGTGKTTTVVRILAALQDQAAAAGQPALQVALVAPTGKAAARLTESIEDQVADLPVDAALRATIRPDAMTIHRALGWRPDRPTQFRHDAEHPLAADVVVVDEASMVDLPLMAKLVDAVRTDARLILLGDRDQLASVEAGAVLGDICHAGPEASPAAPIARCVTHLSRSWRFQRDSGIGALAAAINAGDADAALRALDDEPDLQRVDVPDGARPESLVGDLLVDGYLPVLDAKTPQDALRQLSRFRVLCAHRQGRFGVNALNDLVRDRLVARGRIAPRAAWYSGRPVIVTRNDYALDLFNGDVGITVADADGELRVWFQGRSGTLRSFHPARLPPSETVYAMTVHKSQGSEFDRVLMMLPDRASPILTRELLYTGVTRARSTVTVVSTAEVLTACIQVRIQRASGLRSALWEQ